MTTNTKQNPFRGKAGGGGDKTENPSEDIHDARIIGLVDLGTHTESYKGADAKDKRKCLLVFELDEEMTGTKGTNHVIHREYTMSFHELAALRLLAEALLNEGAKFRNDLDDVDFTQLVGQPCMVQVVHERKDTEKGERVYAHVGAVTAVPKKKRAGFFEAGREPFTWFLGDDLDELPAYLPRVYGITVRDKVLACKEMRGSLPPDDGEVEVGDDYTPDANRNKPPF